MLCTSETGAFVTPDHFQYSFNPVQLCHLDCQRLMISDLCGVNNGEVYLDVTVVYSATRTEHMRHSKRCLAVYERLREHFSQI